MGSSRKWTAWRTLCLLALMLAAVASPAAAADGAKKSVRDKIKHFVIVMLENRSFDHMLGWLKRENPEVEGLTGSEFNFDDPADPNSKTYFVDDSAPDIDPSPDHSVQGTRLQVFGKDDKPTMSGFVMSAHTEKIPPQQVMSCFNPDSAPIINTIAKEFAVFDGFHASVPGPTQVNRLYVHSATSHGMAWNDQSRLVSGMPQKTIYDSVLESGLEFGVYFEELPAVLEFASMRRVQSLARLYTFFEFKYHVSRGKLPAYSFIEPKYFDFLGVPSNDQHPSHSVFEGEKLMKELYEMLRNSPAWNETVLIITYDEHGGFFDHVPPLQDVPNPDGLVSDSPAFNFTSLGVRIPVVMASPWIPKGTVVHAPPPTAAKRYYDHSSIPATAKEVLGLKSFLTARDANAATFEHIFSLDEPRTDCPTHLPEPHPSTARPYDNNHPASELQMEFAQLAAALHGADPSTVKPASEGEIAEFVRKQVAGFISQGLSGWNEWIGIE